jgi:hypothetical protein
MTDPKRISDEELATPTKEKLSEWCRGWFEEHRLSPHDFFVPDMLASFYEEFTNPLARELQLLRKEQRWVPVSEGLPEMNIRRESRDRSGKLNFEFLTSVWVETWHPDGFYGETSLQNKRHTQRRISYIKDNDHWIHKGASHWRPLPSPPEGM